MAHRSPPDAPGEPLSVVGIVVGARPLTAAQRKFNQLIGRINRQRQELADWRAFRQVYQQHLADHYRPAMSRLREKQIAMARLLDRALEGKHLGRYERAMARDMLTQLLAPLLAEAPDPELVRLHDKYAERSFDDGQEADLDNMRTLASEEFGVDVDAVPGESAEELADWIDAQLRARDSTPRRTKRGRKSPKAAALQTKREEDAQNGTRAVRDIFRKLASELHPDRETDPAEQARKTELMQRVNQAYKAGDLLALLELQLSIEQLQPQSLAGMAEERLMHYIGVLEGQVQRLRDELQEFLAPFGTAIEGRQRAGKLSPTTVIRELDVDVREINAVTRTLEADLARFQNTAILKRVLRNHQSSAMQDSSFDMPGEGRPPPRGRGGRGRRTR